MPPGRLDPAAAAELRPPHQLPQPAQDLSTRLRFMTDGRVRCEGEYEGPDDEVEFRQTVDHLLAWVHLEFGLNEAEPDWDPLRSHASWDRIRVDAATNKVTLEGVGWTAEDPKAFELVWQLYQAARDRRILTSEGLVKQLFPPPRPDARAVRSLMRGIPQPLRSCIKKMRRIRPLNREAPSPAHRSGTAHVNAAASHPTRHPVSSTDRFLDARTGARIRRYSCSNRPQAFRRIKRHRRVHAQAHVFEEQRLGGLAR